MLDADGVPGWLAAHGKPTMTLAEAQAAIPLGESTWAPVVRKQDRERWNDWGIGLLLQGDLKGAEYAFRKTTVTLGTVASQ